VIAQLPSGWAVMGNPQVLRGYCLLLPDPVVPHLNAMPPGRREAFLSDMAWLGDAVLEVTNAVRINYALFGNLEPALHAHVIPRYANEPEALATAQPWAYDWARAAPYDAKEHAALRNAIRERLQSRANHRVASRPSDEQQAARVDHLDLTVSDLETSTAFYASILPLLGFVREPDCPEGPLFSGDQFELGLQPARPGTRAALHDRYSPGLHHLAFAAPSRAAVERFWTALQSRGVPILDPPAEYPVYEPGYYAVFFADPDGIKLEYAHRPASRRPPEA